MLEQLLEFVLNHWILSLIWVVLLILLIRHEGGRGGKALSTAEVTQLINSENAKVVDLRSRDEFHAGHLPNAINIPARDMPKRVTELNQYKDEHLILICKTGTTAGPTGLMMSKAGFNKLHKLKGGIIEWQGSNLPLIKG